MPQVQVLSLRPVWVSIRALTFFISVMNTRTKKTSSLKLLVFLYFTKDFRTFWVRIFLFSSFPFSPCFRSFYGFVHTFVHTSKKYISKVSRGFGHYSRMKVPFWILSGCIIYLIIPEQTFRCWIWELHHPSAQTAQYNARRGDWFHCKGNRLQDQERCGEPKRCNAQETNDLLFWYRQKRFIYQH